MGGVTFTIGDTVSWCTICGRELNRHGACINLFCQEQAAAMPRARAYVKNAPASPPPSPRARVARTRPRRLWRGTAGGQSVVVQQVMGQMWSAWQRWGDAQDPTGS